jgi:hypothetical protein
MQVDEFAGAIEGTVRAERLRGAWSGAGVGAGTVVLLFLVMLLVGSPAQKGPQAGPHFRDATTERSRGRAQRVGSPGGSTWLVPEESGQ